MKYTFTTTTQTPANYNLKITFDYSLSPGSSILVGSITENLPACSGAVV